MKPSIERFMPQHDKTSIIHSFLGRYVTIKVGEFKLKGRLKHVDPSQKHNGLGNLILQNNVIIRGSQVMSICIGERKT